MPEPETFSRRHLPHWHRKGAIYWITFRLADSIPQAKLSQWKHERELWLQQYPHPWDRFTQDLYHKRFNQKMEAWLDAGHGSRALARPELRQEVENSILRFEGKRLLLHGMVLMPTHVHLVLEPLMPHSLSALLKGIKSSSARNINRLLAREGSFWMEESYDRIVRNTEEYGYFLEYLRQNPQQAGLKASEYSLQISVFRALPDR